MRTRVFSFRALGCGTLLLAAAGPMRAAALELTSPFLPSSGAPTGAVTTGAPIELHGYMMTQDGEKFSIYDPSKKSATWVKVNEKGYPFVVRSHKIENSTDQVTVEYQGSTLTLALKQAKIASATQAGLQGQAFAGRAGGPGGFGPRGGGGPQTAAPAVPSAEEAARLQAAAIDFQQRQAQRQQAQAALQAAQAAGQVQATGQRGQRANGGNQQQGGQNLGGGRRGQ
ncbi:MAG TPA: hypothetical protein VG838_04445, partial [Opitutaceae bacterium]|nr:hypothetical protein [Opitutaceae bacterium]